ncbi:MAG: UDP-2,3-diacylglucosamine diphosphatase [Ignavibacteria bacterium]|nr:UDP-2,3-diacylglucosamine diphosphatase [Ignavibacteria bacterium]
MNEKKSYFFSDVHLGLGTFEEEKIKERKLIGFLEKIRVDAVKIFIAGDLFDCWIEYRKAVPKGFYRTLSKLNELVEQGIEINFFSGNHDFWLNSYLRDDVGLKLYDYMDTIIDGKRLYIIHGDGLSKGDLGYKIIKKILRNRFNQFLYSWIHPDIGISLAEKSSKKSRFHNENQSYGAEGMENFASDKISEGFDYVIMGHYHKPLIKEISSNGKKGYFITLGDWIKNFSYGVLSDGKFEIKKYV